MNLINLIVFLIFSYGSLGNKTSNSFGNDEVYYGGFRNYFFTPNPADYSEIFSSEDFENDFLEKSMENDFNVFSNSDFTGGHELNELIRLSDATARKFLLDQSFQPEHLNFTLDYDNSEPRPSQVFMRRQVNEWENPDEDNNFRNGDIYPKTEYAYDYGQYFKDFPFNPTNNSSAERFENNLQVEPPQYYQKHYKSSQPLFRERQDQSRHMSLSANEEKPNLDIMDEKIKRRKNQKKNPCRLYLQFLKYAFKELDKNSEYYDDSDEEYSDWEADGSRQVFSTQLLGPTLYIDNSGRVFQVNSQGNSIQSVDRFVPGSRDLERNFIIQNFRTTNSPHEQRNTETPPVPPIYNSFILTYDRPPEFLNRNTESSTSDAYTHPPTVPTEMNTETPYTEWPYFLTTTLPPPSPPSPPHQPPREDFERRSGVPWENFPPNLEPNLNQSSVYFPRPENPSTPHPNPFDGSYIRANTKVTFDNKPKEDKEPDCNDKMLPCPDTFNITYPLNGYCNRYVSCESGVAIRRTCANGLHFNVITKNCDLPHNSICSYVCPEPSGRFGIPGDCSGYFICENSIAEYRMCPPRMHWDVRTNTCTFAALSSCPMKCSTPNEIKSYKGDCKAYIICHNGIPFYHKCPTKLVFNKEVHTCVPENTYNCINEPRLMTKILNPSHLCKKVDEKLSENSWCKYYNTTENTRAEDKPTGAFNI